MYRYIYVNRLKKSVIRLYNKELLNIEIICRNKLIIFIFEKFKQIRFLYFKGILLVSIRY